MVLSSLPLQLSAQHPHRLPANVVDLQGSSCSVSAPMWLAIAPVAEELQTLTVVHICGTRRLTEENIPTWEQRLKAIPADALAAPVIAMGGNPQARGVCDVRQIEQRAARLGMDLQDGQQEEERRLTGTGRA